MYSALLHRGRVESPNQTAVERDLDWKARSVWIALAAASLPSIFETEWKIEIAFGSVYLADILLIYAMVVASRYIRTTPGSGVLVYCAIFAIASGAIAGATAPWIIRDSRPFFYLIAGLVIGSFALRNPNSIRFGIRLLIVVVSVTAFLAMLSQLGASNIVGTERGAANAIYYNGEARYLSAKRIQTEPVPLALLLLCCACTAWVFKFNLAKFIGKNWLILGIVTTLALTTMAYSRNSLVGLGTALILTVLVPAATTRVERAGRLIVLTIAILLFVGIPVWIGYQFGYFGNVIDSFSARVIGGIAPDVIGTDPSVGWRFTEMNATLSFVSQHPIDGSGFGAYYRDRIAGEPFRGDQGRLYMHNFFTLLFVKFGVVIGAVVLVVIATAVVRMVRAGHTLSRNSSGWSMLACSFMAILAVSAVAPVMYSRSFAVIGGAMIAAGLLSTNYSRDAPTGVHR